MNPAPPDSHASGSLRTRMLISAALVLVFFLGVMGLVLDNAFRVSAEEAVSERLQLHIYALIAASDEQQVADADSLYLPDELQEPHFNSPGSGLFGLVFDESGKEIWRSRSAIGLALPINGLAGLQIETNPGVASFGRLEETEGLEPLFFLSYPVIWQTGAGNARYVYLVLQNLAPYRQEISTYRKNLWAWLIAGVLVLVAVQAGIMRWGLAPVAALEGDLKAIEEGRQEYLEGQYPEEIAGVTKNLNLLLADERRQRERYRNTLADLAHSLKTPLSILKNEAANPALADETASSLVEQVDRMDQIVSYQLERAVASSSRLYAASVEIAPVSKKLVDTLTRVYIDKGVAIESHIDAKRFAGDERDLFELLGNLLDNACKYGGQSIRLSMTDVGDQLQILVEDDGPGIEVSDRVKVLERGARLDSRESGQGIGLAVVSEIAERYEGTVLIESSELGGARVQVLI